MSERLIGPFDRVEFDEHRWYVVINFYRDDSIIAHRVIGNADCGEPTLFDTMSDWDDHHYG